jgi:predicted TIM-barrel fold metal-dependent hydrolase
VSDTCLDIIDCHLHLFNLTQGQYAWLQPQNPPFWPDKKRIHRSYTEQDLSLAHPLRLAGFVHIEAGFDNQRPWCELAWLEQHCTLAFKSVANLDLSSPHCQQQLEKLLLRPSLVGIRHILDDEAASILNDPRVKANLQQLANHKLRFDAQLSLCNTEGVNALLAILDNTPELTVILNHAGWPPDVCQPLFWQNWCNNLARLAQYPKVAIKLSGWEMPDRHYTLDKVQTVLHQCMASFGAKRIMLGSNFPLCTWSRSYQQLWQLYAKDLQLEPHLRQRLVCQNAAQWYGF